MKIKSNNPFLVFAKKYGNLKIGWGGIDICDLLLGVLFGVFRISFKYAWFFVYMYLGIICIALPMYFKIFDFEPLLSHILLFLGMSIAYLVVYGDAILEYTINKIPRCPKLEITKED